MPVQHRDSRFFRGWPVVGVGFLVYGLGLAPAYYSWGFLAPEMIGSLGLTRAQIGSTFGLFTLTYALSAPLAAAAMERVGLRAVVTCGATIAAIAFWLTSRAESAGEISLAFGVMGGLSVGSSSLLPAQALPVFWFRRYRARATAIILLGAAIVGVLVPTVADGILRSGDWRGVWRCIAWISVGVAIIAGIFLRNRPEDVGQLPDGDAPESGEAKRGTTREPEELGVWQAIATPQFALVTLACVANTVPWRTFTAHGRLHFEDLGFTSSVAAAILGVRVGMSAIGRLGGSVGDFVDPRHVLAISLGITALGTLGLATTTSVAAAYACIMILGVSFGVAFTTEPVVFARIVGTRAFLGSNGLRLAILGAFSWLGPALAGFAADRTGSYTSTFVVIAGLSLTGAVAILLCRPLAPFNSTASTRSRVRS